MGNHQLKLLARDRISRARFKNGAVGAPHAPTALVCYRRGVFP